MKSTLKSTALVLTPLFLVCSAAGQGLYQRGEPRVDHGALPGTVKSYTKITSVPGLLHIGGAVCSLGDVDGNGVDDWAFGDVYGVLEELVPGFPVPVRGAVVVAFREADGSFSGSQRITQGEGGFVGSLDLDDEFAASVCAVPDLDGNGVNELLVGAPGEIFGPIPVVYLLFLDTDGSVLDQVDISDGSGGFQETLTSSDDFGASLVVLGDVDGNGVPDIASGKAFASSYTSYVFSMRLNASGNVANTWKLGQGLAGFVGPTGGNFGRSLALLADLDADGIDELVVGGDDDESLWTVFLNPNGTVRAELRTDTSFLPLANDDDFGSCLTSIGDLNGDGLTDLAVGAARDDDNLSGQNLDQGALWILFSEPDGSFSRGMKISELAGGFAVDLSVLDRFGASLAAPGDLDGDAVPDLLVGAPGDGRGVSTASPYGALYVLHLNGRP